MEWDPAWDDGPLARTVICEECLATDSLVSPASNIKAWHLRYERVTSPGGIAQAIPCGSLCPDCAAKL